MTREEKELALYCLKASSDYHSEVCEECIKYPNCDHTGQDDVTETIIKALEQEPKSGHWKIIPSNNNGEYRPRKYACSECGWEIDLCRGLQQETGHRLFCEHCGAKMFESQERSDKEC